MANLLQNGNKINVKNFHGSLTTVVRAQIDKYQQQISIDTILNRKRRLYYCSNRHFSDLLLSVITFSIEMVSMIFTVVKHP